MPEAARECLALKAGEGGLEAGAAGAHVGAQAVEAGRRVLDEGLALIEALGNRTSALKAEFNGASALTD